MIKIIAKISVKNQNVNNASSADWSKFTRENNQNKVLRPDWSVWKYAEIFFKHRDRDEIRF